jgi:Tfp pilus assembly protein PilN
MGALMQRLDLDFRRKREASRWLGLALLAAGAAAAATGLWHHQALEQEALTVEREIARLEKTSRPVARAPTREERDFGPELKRAEQVVRQLALPWDRLFQAVEAASSKNVALLSVQPDSSRHEVRIYAEAKNFSAMLGYIERLQAGDWLKQVRLENHQVREQDPERPVRFTLTASWGKDQ